MYTMADRMQMLRQITEISFMVDDLRLYLDMHPTEKEALAAFGTAMQQRKQLLKDYAAEFEPLTADCICPETNNRTDFGTRYPGQEHFAWTDGPAPWEGGAN